MILVLAAVLIQIVTESDFNLLIMTLTFVNLIMTDFYDSDSNSDSYSSF